MFDKDRLGTYDKIEQFTAPERKWQMQALERQQELVKYRDAITTMKRELLAAASPITLPTKDGELQDLYLIEIRLALKIIDECLVDTKYQDLERVEHLLQDN